jgi:hypothetical protein
MFRIMFDSVNPAAIPEGASLVAGYVDGAASAWPAGAWDRFPGAELVRINVTGDPAHGGDALDVERFDATPDHAPGWFDERTKAGARGLTIYCNRSTLPAVEQAMGTRSYFRWIATLDGTLVIPGFKPMQGPAAIQFAPAGITGIDADMSLVLSPYFHPQPSLQQIIGAAKAAQAETAQLLQLIQKYGAAAGS